ncbi:transposase, partial [Corynebacterium belfantii]|uniref:IS3 family transposase n=1 Tax=Corynebacterium belfantii TaxID=2014537 RepID=UPI0018D494E4|nr:transposase [Corynebacterium belfantii]MBG9332264.1 transposase [Corynebacterium belfantii]
SNATFGYRRIWRALRNNNTIVNKKVVRRLMREQGLVSKIRRKGLLRVWLTVFLLIFRPQGMRLVP